MFDDFMKDWDEITNLKKLLKSLKKEIIKFKKKFFENIKKQEPLCQEKRKAQHPKNKLGSVYPHMKKSAQKE